MLDNGGSGPLNNAEETLGIIVIYCYFPVSIGAPFLKGVDESNFLKELLGGGGSHYLCAQICELAVRITTSKNESEIFEGIAKWQAGEKVLTIGGYPIFPGKRQGAQIPLEILIRHVCRFGN